MINSRNKGKAGESEFCQRFSMFFNTELKRNLLQTREGGSDITGCEPYVIEVKRVEQLALPAWWRQVLAATDLETQIPVVAYRQNRTGWQFLFPSSMIHSELPSTSYIIIDEDTFVRHVMLTKTINLNSST